MGVYNGEKYLREAVDSILNQTFTDFEFIIVDDGSTDGTKGILDSYNDTRIVRLNVEKNRGHARALNWGISVARGEYIARMDADDVSEPQRLKKQVEYLDAHPEASVLATWAKLIRGAEKTDEVWMSPTNPAVLAWRLSWKNPICHPSVMMRLDWLNGIGRYNEHLYFAEDCDLWTRVIMAGGMMAMLPEPLLRYRYWPSQLSAVNNESQGRESAQSSRKFVEWLVGSTVSIEQLQAVHKLYGGVILSELEERQALTLARQIQQRCEKMFGGIGAREIRNHISDALIYSADYALKKGGGRQARSNSLHALRVNPLRAARPWTIWLLLQSFRLSNNA